MDGPQKETELADEQENGLFYSIEIYRKCVAADIFTRLDDEFVPLVIEPAEKIEPVLAPFIEKLQKIRGTMNQNIQSVDFPSDFDPEVEVKNGTQTAIKILVDSGLADLAVIKGAAKYVGPSNTRYHPDVLDYHFNATDQYRDYLDQHGIVRDYSKPFPPPPHSRTQFFTIDIGGIGVRKNAGEYLKSAEKLGIPMDIVQALRLEITRGCAHEYGHAIVRGLDNAGKKTLATAIASGYITDHESLDFTVDQVHDEFFARGIENAVEKRYLQQLGYTPEQVEALLNDKSKDYSANKTLAYNYLRDLQALGYNPRQIIKLQNAVYFAAKTVDKTEDPTLYLWPVSDIIAYQTEPYTEEQLSALMQ